MKRFILLLMCLCFIMFPFCGCSRESEEKPIESVLQHTKTMELKYANQFSVDYYERGFKLISTSDGSRFLVIPENEDTPQDIPSDIVPIHQPVKNIYLAATSAMCLFDALDRLDSIKLSGTRADGWYIKNAAEAMKQGKILYAGKYSEPDYEMILKNDCHLAIQSTMISHASNVKDKLESLGIAVLVDRSSYESHPLGRTEWLRLYAALLNEEENAEKLFYDQAAYIDNLNRESAGEKTVAFFCINSSGQVMTRKSGDYVSKMIELAGGKNIFDDLGDRTKATSTTIVEMETFYAKAKDADIIIYNSTIGGEIENMEEFLRLNSMLKNFKAVSDGNVWCTSQNMFQETMKLGKMIQNFHDILTDNDSSLTKLDYLYRLK